MSQGWKVHRTSPHCQDALRPPALSLTAGISSVPPYSGPFTLSFKPDLIPTEAVVKRGSSSPGGKQQQAQCGAGAQSLRGLGPASSPRGKGRLSRPSSPNQLPSVGTDLVHKAQHGAPFLPQHTLPPITQPSIFSPRSAPPGSCGGMEGLTPALAETPAPGPGCRSCRL